MLKLCEALSGIDLQIAWKVLYPSGCSSSDAISVLLNCLKADEVVSIYDEAMNYYRSQNSSSIVGPLKEVIEGLTPNRMGLYLMKNSRVMDTDVQEV